MLGRFFWKKIFFYYQKRVASFWKATLANYAYLYLMNFQWLTFINLRRQLLRFQQARLLELLLLQRLRELVIPL